MNKYMKLAYQDAKKAYAKGEVPVEAVIVLNDKVIARAHNLREAKQSFEGHAEFLAMQKAAKKLNSWRLEDCIVYVTLEPCSMCAGAMLQARVKEVICGTTDPKAGAVESKLNLFDISFNHKVKYSCSYDLETTEILKDFFKNLRDK